MNTLNCCNILLIGARASGKTILGRRLAARFHRPFIDLDEQTLKCFKENSITAVWATYGERTWRVAEHQALVDVLQHSNQIIALGGGTPMIADAAKLIHAARKSTEAWVIYLKCDPAILAQRLRREPGDRPSLTIALSAAEGSEGSGGHAVNEISDVLAEREPVYLKLADLVFDNSNNTTESALEVLSSKMEESGVLQS